MDRGQDDALITFRDFQQVAVTLETTSIQPARTGKPIGPHVEDLRMVKTETVAQDITPAGRAPRSREAVPMRPGSALTDLYQIPGGSKRPEHDAEDPEWQGSLAKANKVKTRPSDSELGGRDQPLYC
jgi:hypothetical protein